MQAALDNALETVLSSVVVGKELARWETDLAPGQAQLLSSDMAMVVETV